MIHIVSLSGMNAGTIIAVGIGIYFLAAVLPGAITNIFGANQTGWDATTKSLWALLPLAVVALFVLFFVQRQKQK